MTGWRGVFAGVLALVALETIVSTRAAANRTAGLFGDLAAIVTRVLDPNVAAIPDIAHYYDQAGSSTTAAAVQTTPTQPDPPANGKTKPQKPVVAPPPVTYAV